MSTNNNFQPNWISSPGETISDILIERKITNKEFAKKMGCTAAFITKLLNGKYNITLEIADKLAKSLGSSKAFWLKREAQYQEDIDRAEQKDKEKTEWLQCMPLSDMVKFGWINKTTKKADKIKACLRFFDVTSVDEWYQAYNNLHMKVAFRTSASFDSTSESVITWLRQGELESNKIHCQPWNKHRLSESIIQARALARIGDPEIFIPKLRSIFSECGVALIIAPTPKGCRASGATYFTSPNKAILMLSLRYLSDDHFWFSLFHEAGHILLHENTSLFLEDINNCNKQEEDEANNFSENILIPNEHQEEFSSLRANQWRQIIRFSKKLNLSPGTVVGQLQFHGIIEHKQLNKLKTRFKWNHEII